MFKQIELHTKLDPKERFNLVVDEIKHYLLVNNIDPDCITLYKDIESLNIKTISGVSLLKSTFTTAGFKSKDVLHEINPKTIDHKLTEFENFCKGNNLSLLGVERNPKNFVNSKIIFRCNICGYEENITIHSLKRRANLCKKCKTSGVLGWVEREEEFFDICTYLNVIPLYDSISEYKSIVKSNTLEVECLLCGYKDSRNFKTFVHQKSFACRKCNPTWTEGVFGHTTEVNGIIFDSKIEASVYQKLLNNSGVKDIVTHMPYRDLCNVETPLISDFVVNGDTIIEVTGFNRSNHKKYFDTINLKKYLANSSGYRFELITSVAAVDHLF